jgi:phosphoribosylformimino-5-aminoimidazole carboxamide ribotide isomerase
MVFEILAAIDLRGGRVVRLRQGDFGAETDYADDPLVVADRFVAARVPWIHIVDLDGARSGGPEQTPTIRAIVDRVGPAARCEVAGGLRSDAAVEVAFQAGAARVVLGTAALEDPTFVRRSIDRYGLERIVVALDVRGAVAVGGGWSAGAPSMDALTALSTLADVGVATFEVTAIDRDGLLEGPDLDLLERCVALGRGAIVASAGISSLADLEAVRRIGCIGAIVGRALYEGRIDLAEAVSLTRES